MTYAEDSVLEGVNCTGLLELFNQPLYADTILFGLLYFHSVCLLLVAGGVGIKGFFHAVLKRSDWAPPESLGQLDLYSMQGPKN